MNVYTSLSALQQALVSRQSIQVELYAQELPAKQLLNIAMELCKSDDAEALEWLGVGGNEALFNHAASSNALKIVRALLPKVQEQSWFSNTFALSKAIQAGAIEMTAYLVQYVPASLHHNSVLLQAIETDRIDLIDLLLPSSDPKALKSQALRLALRKNNEDVIRRIIAVSDPVVAGDYLIGLNNLPATDNGGRSGWTDTQRWQAIDRLGIEVEPVDRHRWLAEHGDQRLPKTADQVLTDLRLKSLEDISTGPVKRLRRRG